MAAPALSHIVDVLKTRFAEAFARAFGPEHALFDPMLRFSDGRFGDLQCNAPMSLAKTLGLKSREVAEKIVAVLDVNGVCTPVGPQAIAGPGFINLTLTAEALGQQMDRLLDDARLGVPAVAQPQRVVVDYCGANIAKQMHVGHLRSTVIGDAVARVLEFAGHDVIRQNHIGDWGLQMGMVTFAVQEAGIAPEQLTLRDLERLYKDVNTRQEKEPGFRAQLIERTRVLQNTPQNELTVWQAARQLTLDSVHVIFERLDVSMKPEHVCGESFYADEYGPMVQQLLDNEIAVENQGAVCLFAPGFTNQDGDPKPFIIRSKDGTFLYATFDLAALRYRVQQLGAERLVYTHDARQAEHFEMLFAVAKMIGFAALVTQTDHPPTVGGQATPFAPMPRDGADRGFARMQFAAFGTVLGDNNKPLKTRTGENVKLIDLIEEAEKRALDVVREKNPDLPADRQAAVAHTVGIGALKYADLSSERARDYVFSWDRMLALKGNTAPYLQYAGARIASIFRKAQEQALMPPALSATEALPASVNSAEFVMDALTPSSVAAEPNGRVMIAEAAERRLAIVLLQFPDAVDYVATRLEPHRLCAYLYELAATFSTFYEACPVLTGNDTVRESRLALCRLTADTLRLGLGLLGIGTLDEM